MHFGVTVYYAGREALFLGVDDSVMSGWGFVDNCGQVCSLSSTTTQAFILHTDQSHYSLIFHENQSVLPLGPEKSVVCGDMASQHDGDLETCLRKTLAVNVRLPH